MSKQPSAWQRAVAFGYDLIIQGPPETIFLGPMRRKLITPMKGLVLDVGAGTGLSLRYYAPGTRVVATDVHEASLARLKNKARSSPAARVLVTASSAEHLPFPDNTFDGLVCNLALCTIPDPRAALAEIRRVLKPGSPARFLEHVRADGGWESGMQDLLAPTWAMLAGGCRLNQDTEKLIRAAGLRVMHVEKRSGLLLPVKLIWTRTGREEAESPTSA